MRRIIFFILSLTSFSNFTSAQNWLSDTSTIWTYTAFFAMSSSTINIEHKYEKDTTVGNVLCKKIGSNLQLCNTNEFWCNPIFSFEKNDTVYFFIDGLFRPTYYFNANVGDTLAFYENPQLDSCGRDSLVLASVDSITMFNFNNRSLKKWHLNILTNRPNNNSFSFSQELGSNSFIYPILSCGLFDGDVIRLCTFNQNQQILSNNMFPCNHGTGIVTTNKNELVFNLSPNPTDKSLTVSSETKKINSVTIYDLYGRQLSVLLIDDVSPLYEIDVSKLPKGMYILEAIFDNDKRGLKRFIKK